MRRLLGLGLFVAALVLGWRFAAVNSDAVTIDLLVGEFGGVDLWAALLAAFGAGAAITALAGLYQLAKLRLVARRYRKTMHSLEAEVHQLRNLPLAPEEPGVSESAAASVGPLPRGALERGP